MGEKFTSRHYEDEDDSSMWQPISRPRSRPLSGLLSGPSSQTPVNPYEDWKGYIPISRKVQPRNTWQARREQEMKDVISEDDMRHMMTDYKESVTAFRKHPSRETLARVTQATRDYIAILNLLNISTEGIPTQKDFLKQMFPGKGINH